MADAKQDKHEKALDLTEAALEALDTGDEKKADQLIDQAKKLDPSAVREVVKDLEEAEHSSAIAGEDEDLDFEEVDEEDEEAAG